MVPLSAQTTSSALTNHAADRIVAPIDESQRVVLPGNIAPLAQARFDRGPAPGSTPTGRLFLALACSPQQQQALTQFLADLQNPASPNYHHWLSPAQYGALYGPSDDDLQSIESWLSSHGFTIDQVPAARNVVQFSGTFDQLQSAFHTPIHAFSVNGQTHYATIADPQIPAALAPVIAAIGPLSNFRPQPALVMGPQGHYDPSTGSIQPGLTLLSGSTPLLFIDPADAATLYDAPNGALNPNYSGTTYDGAGITIGIIGASDIVMQDIENYRTAFLGESTTSANLPTVIVDGDDPGAVPGWNVEALLDNEVAGGLAPKAKIDFYTSADSDLSSGLLNATFRAIDDNAVSVLSASVQACESGLGSAGNQLLLEATQQAAAQGITVVVAAGDSGSAGCDDFDTATQAQYGFAVNGFASTPWDVAVGGTDFDGLPNAFSTYATSTSSGTAPYYRTALQYVPEEPWNDSNIENGALADNHARIGGSGQSNIVAGSGGVSTVYPKPAFQASLTPADSARDLPDVSLFAGNGLYQALWVLCSDSTSDGNTGQSYTNCQNTGGQFNSATNFDGVGGTSAAAPAFAGILALVEQKVGSRLGQADTILYQLAQSKPAVFHDIVTGNNSVPCASGSPNCGINGFLTGYNAGTGYDLASGLGSVDAAALVSNWSSVHLTNTSTNFTLNGSTAAYSGVHGASVTFAIGVTPTSVTGAAAVITTANQTAGGTASGPQNNGQLSIPLTGGSGTATSNGLPGGTYTVSARYGGDTADAASTSTPISVTISPEASTTALALHAYNPQTGVSVGTSAIPYGSQIFADAQVEGAAEGSATQGLATGTVTFTDNGATVGTATVTSESNLASWPPQNTAAAVLAVGPHSLTAAYSGDASYNPSTSSAAPFTIVKAATAISASGTPTSVTYNTGATLSFTVTSPVNTGVAPTGSVTLTDNGATLATVGSLALATQSSGGSTFDYVLSGQTTIAGSQLPSGNSAVTLAYSGDADYAGSMTTWDVYNSAGVGSFSLSNSGDVTVTAGQTGSVTITVTPSGGFSTPVTLSCSNLNGADATCPAATLVLIGSGPVMRAIAVTTAFGATPGTYPIVVNGIDETGKITASTTFNLTIQAIPANAGFSLSNNGPLTFIAGTPANAILSITPANGYIGQVESTCTVTTSIANPTSPLSCGNLVSSVTGSSVVSVSLPFTMTASTSPGVYTATVQAQDSLNSAINASTAITVNVSAPPPASFTLINNGNLTVSPGQTGAAQITLTPTSFAGLVNFTCSVTTSISNPNDPPTCLSIAPVNISGASSITTTVDVLTTAPTSGALVPPFHRFFLAGGGATLALALFFGIPARRRAWRDRISLLVLALAVVIAAGVIGCGGNKSSGNTGGGSSGGTTPGAYTVNVNAADAATGKITASTTLTLTVD